jgi:hypothetical protein
VIPKHRESDPCGMHGQNQVQDGYTARSTVHQVADEHHPAAERMRVSSRNGSGIAKSTQQSAQLIYTSVNVADDIKRGFVIARKYPESTQACNVIRGCRRNVTHARLYIFPVIA